MSTKERVSNVDDVSRRILMINNDVLVFRLLGWERSSKCNVRKGHLCASRVFGRAISNSWLR